MMRMAWVNRMAIGVGVEGRVQRSSGGRTGRTSSGQIHLVKRKIQQDWWWTRYLR